MLIEPDPPECGARRKARGAFFTPTALAEFVADWAVRSSGDAVLEPSCGDAVFLSAVAARGHRGPLTGVEIHPPTAAAARRALSATGCPVTVRTGDFFAEQPAVEGYDAVLGNPPYIRYQDFTGADRARARAAALAGGVRLTGLASSWAPFTVHAARFLRPGGRLGLVLPAELLSVNYAAEVRRFLMERFASVRLVLFTERVFPAVIQEVVLLLADGYDPTGRQGTDHCEVFQARNADDLGALSAGEAWRPDQPGSKWTAAALSAAERQAYDAATTAPGFGVLADWGETTLGMVTGNNHYFALSPARVQALGLANTDLLPLSPPGSRHLRGLALTAADRLLLGDQGRGIWLFRPERPSRAAAAYLRAGERAGVPLAYKCRVRSPWWQVPLVPPADLLLTYMNADTPRLVTNRSRAHHLNSVHGVYLRSGLRALGSRLLPIAALNSVTLAGAETVGRAYGGGLLKLEPGEADRLPVPAPAVLAAAAPALSRVRGTVAARLAGGDLLGAAAEVDAVLLTTTLGMADDQLASIRRARERLVGRRRSRGRPAGG